MESVDGGTVSYAWQTILDFGSGIKLYKLKINNNSLLFQKSVVDFIRVMNELKIQQKLVLK